MKSKTLLKGHKLWFEGATIYDDNGQTLPAYRSNGRAKCECGALSDRHLSQNAAKKWHREHKDALR